MAEGIINIKIQAKDDPTVNISVIEAGTVSGASNLNPSIQYVATGGIGPTGDTGATGSVSAEDSVVQANMATDSVGTPEIIDGSVTHAKIANGAIYGNKILDDSVSGSKLLDNSIGNSKIQNDSIDASKIAFGAISQELLEAGVITRDKIQGKSITAGQIANNTIVTELYVDNSINGDKIEDNVTLAGTVTVNHLELEGSSPALIEGPAGDDINIKTHDQLNIQNTSGSTIASFDQSGNLSLSGTVDGIDIATDVAANTLKLGISTSQANEITANTAKVGITPSQASAITVNTSKTSFPGFGTTNSTALVGNTTTITTSQANAITANTAKPDLTVENAGTVHSSNYTDTVYTHPTSHPISLITGLQTALNAKQDSIGNEDLTIQQTDGLQDALDAKVDDSQVLTNVPANAVFTDTVYTHPANHAISVITGLQSALNAKQDSISNISEIVGNEDLTIAMTDGLQDALDGKVDDSQVLTNVPANAVFTDTNTTYSVQDGELSQNNFTDADHTKLNNIEANATADQTKADIDALGIAATTAVSLTAGDKIIDGNLGLGGDDGDAHFLTRAAHSDNEGGRLHVQAGNGGGANKGGGSLFLSAGLGTGSYAGGNIVFQSSAAGSSGTSVNSVSLLGVIDNSGNLSIEGDLTVKGNDIKDDDGTTCITFDSSGNTTVANTLNATLTGNVTGNADTATALTSGDKTIEGNLRLGGTGDTGNNWLSIDAQSGDDSSGGGITFFETGTYDVDSPQYGAKIVYNETADEFAIGTMHNNVFMRQIYFSRQLARTYFNGDLQIRDSSPSITVVDTSTTVASGDVVGILNFSNDDDDGSTLRIQAVATEDHASGTNGGTKLEIKTTPNGSSAEEVALTVGEDKSLTSPGLLTSMQRHVMRCGFFGTASRMYLPFNYGGTFENTSTAGYSEYGAVIMPCDGYVESVIIRSETACANSIVTILVASDGTEVPTLSPGSFASPTVNMAADDTSYKFTGFVNQGGTSNSFSAGDVIMIAFDPTNSSQDTTATAVLVFDWNNQL
mgnify:CR=1 FL=1